MHIVNLEFFSLETEPVAKLFGETGVYVLWSPYACDRPTYIGEGVILKRLSRHVDWLTRGVTGLGAVTSLEGTNFRQAKIDAEIGEAVLLRIADDIGGYPTKTEIIGGWKIDAFGVHHPLRRLTKK